MKKLSVAIIGAGNIAGLYDLKRIKSDDGVYSHAGAYQQSGRFELQTICDIDYRKALSFKRSWGVRSATTSLDDVCRDYHDVISVCTPEKTHSKIIEQIIIHKAAKTIFAEKPLAPRLDEISKIIRLAEKNRVNLVVNYQRRFDKSLARIAALIKKNKQNLLAGNAYYMKGLNHIGSTAIDTIIFLCGVPSHVLSYNRMFNEQAGEYTYEFILFYDTFNISVKSIDSETAGYSYHFFEIDLLFKDKRLTINDNSRNIKKTSIGNYAYSGVKVLDESNIRNEETGYKFSIPETVKYIYKITQGNLRHVKNTPRASYINKYILDAVIRSYRERKKIRIGIPT